jgi:hypothetical protein
MMSAGRNRKANDSIFFSQSVRHHCRPPFIAYYADKKNPAAAGSGLVTPENTNWVRGLAPHAAPSNRRRFSLPDTSETNPAHSRETVNASPPDASEDNGPPSLATARALS